MLSILQYSNAYELEYSFHVIIMIYELAYSSDVSHSVFRRIPSANYMCVQNVQTTHIETNALLYNVGIY